MSVPSYVLQKFSDDEMITMEKVIDRAADACEALIKGETFQNVMNQYNGEVI